MGWCICVGVGVGDTVSMDTVSMAQPPQVGDCIYGLPLEWIVSSFWGPRNEDGEGEKERVCTTYGH